MPTTPLIRHARPDDHDVVLACEDWPQPLGVVEGAQQMHPGYALGARQPDRFGAGREDQDVVRDGPVGGVQLVCGAPEAQHLAPEQQFDAEGLEVDVEGGTLRLAQQDGLGQRRPVVRLMGFRAQQRHRAREPLFPQGDRGLHPGHARPHDDHAPRLRSARCALCLRQLTHPITIDN